MRRMIHSAPVFNRSRLLIVISLLLSAGFFATALFSYYVSREAIRDALIGQDLPLTSSNIYSEIQKDLIRPVLISSTMASDTFLRDWVLRGETTVPEMARFLGEVKARYGAYSSFFVSDRSRNYYTANGILKQVSPDESRDAWYYRVARMKEDYEINVDPDLANKDSLTIFVNYRVFDFAGNYIGATGVGLTVDAVRHLIDEYQARFKRTIYFVNSDGQTVLGGKSSGSVPRDLRTAPGLREQLSQILASKSGSYSYISGGDHFVLHVNYLPELKWFLFVEQNEDIALAEIRHTLLVNLLISLLVTIVVITLTHMALRRYQFRVEEMATTDKLTGLLNRHAATLLVDQLMLADKRQPRPITVLLADIDHFKTINDRFGHRSGDEVLAAIGQQLKASLRASDYAVRWGGEEFLIILQNCIATEGLRIAEKLRETMATSQPVADKPSLHVTLSIGVCQHHAGETMDQTIGRADKALYRAKDEGRNQVRMADAAGT